MILLCGRAIPEAEAEEEAEDATAEDIKKIPQFVIAPPPPEADGCGKLRNSVCRVPGKERQGRKVPLTLPTFYQNVNMQTPVALHYILLT